jgi:hypothetical protein
MTGHIIRLTIFLFIFLAGCYPFMRTDVTKYITPVPTTTKTLDIPKYPSEHPYTYWHFSKQKEAQLKLSSPERNADSVLYRVWITNPAGPQNQPHGLIEIKLDSSNWTGQLILMRVDIDARELKETITSSKTWTLTPKTSWTYLVDSLFKLQIEVLPTDEKIPNYYTEETRYNNNATTFSFEYATRTNYRFYQYSNIYRAPSKFWQPKYVISILDLLESEIKWDSIAKKHFK